MTYIDVSEVQLSAIQFHVVRADGQVVDFTDFVTEFRYVDHVNIAGAEVNFVVEGTVGDVLKIGGEGSECVVSAPLFSLDDMATRRRELWRGTFEEVTDDRTAGTLSRTVVGYDIGNALARSQEDLVFVGKTLDQVFAEIASAFSIPIRALPRTSKSLGNIVGRGETLWDVLQRARQRHFDLTGEVWRIRARGGRMEMVLQGSQDRWIEFDQESLSHVRRAKSLASVVNRVKVYGQFSGETAKPSVEATFENDRSAQLYGRRQQVAYQTDAKADDSKEAAEQTIRRMAIPRDEITLTGWAVPSLRAGEQVRVHDPEYGLSAVVYNLESVDCGWDPGKAETVAGCKRDAADPGLILGAVTVA